MSRIICELRVSINGELADNPVAIAKSDELRFPDDLGKPLTLEMSIKGKSLGEESPLKRETLGFIPYWYLLDGREKKLITIDRACFITKYSWQDIAYITATLSLPAA